MNNEKNILQVLDQSACLRKGQLLGYLNKSLYPEELRAVELHLSSCALCSDALEGMETIQHADQLIASIQLPVLPAVIIPEKVIEKKEPLPVKVAEPVGMSHPKGRHAKTSLSPKKNISEVRPVAKKMNWIRPLGIAAALLIGCGVLWYFEIAKNNQETVIASNANTDTLPSTITTSQDASIAAAVNDSAKKALIQKRNDSSIIALKKAERLKTQKDSMQLLASAKSDSVPSKSSNASQVAAAIKESPAVATNEDNKTSAKQAFAADQSDLKKKETPKSSPSDFESGMQKYKDNNFASALLYFKTAESDKNNPKHWEAVFYSGMCNKSLNKRRKAIKYFQQIVDANAPQAKAAQKQLDNLNEKN